MISGKKVDRPTRRLLAFASMVFIVSAGGISCSTKAENNAATARNQAMPTAAPASGKLQPPDSIEAEHKEIHEQLEAALRSGGKTGEAAKAVEERLSVHFEKEEQYALPQLGLLETLAAGNVSPDMKKAIELSDKLKAELPKMMEEHKGIVQALDALKAAAEAEKKQEAIHFVEKLGAHARNEEEVMYPAAVLVGEYLKLKLAEGTR